MDCGKRFQQAIILARDSLPHGHMATPVLSSFFQFLPLLSHPPPSLLFAPPHSRNGETSATEPQTSSASRGECPGSYAWAAAWFTGGRALPLVLVVKRLGEPSKETQFSFVYFFLLESKRKLIETVNFRVKKGNFNYEIQVFIFRKKRSVDSNFKVYFKIYKMLCAKFHFYDCLKLTLGNQRDLSALLVGWARATQEGKRNCPQPSFLVATRWLQDHTPLSSPIQLLLSRCWCCSWRQVRPRH